MTSLLRNRVLGVCAFVPLLSLGGVVIFLYQHPRPFRRTEIRRRSFSTTVCWSWLGTSRWHCRTGFWGALYMYYVVRVIQMVERSLLSKVAWVFALSIAAPIAIPIAWWKMDRRP